MIDLKRISEGKQQREPRVTVYGGDGIGKAQPVDAKVLTPTGFVEMGSIAVGDLVIGGDGQPTQVIGVFPQDSKMVFRVTMKDGAETECCEDHLWATRTVEECPAGLPPTVRSLKEIRETIFSRTKDRQPNARGDSPTDYPNHRVSVVGAVQFDSIAKLPLHPYLLGLLLGDGSLGGICVEFHKPEDDVLDRLAALLPNEDTVTKIEIGLRIRRKAHNNKPSETRQALSLMGLHGTDSLTKFIPEPYLFASVEERTQLLRGLFDTDGHVITSGQRVEFSTSSSKLCDGTMFLIRSLGGTVTLREKSPTYTYKGEKRTGAKSYRMLAYFPNGICPVSSAKHLAKWKADQTTYYRSITEITEVGEKECRCIQVAAADGLYVTDDFIVTHNTRFAAGAPDPFFLDVNKGSLAYDVKRAMPETWSETLEWIGAVEANQVKCKTLVIDVAGDLEHMGNTEFFPNTTIDKWDGGYGRGDTYALTRWRELLGALERVWTSGKAIVFTAHMKVKAFNDPSGPSYDRFQVSLRDQIAGLLRGWSDYVFFCREEVSQQKVAGENKAVTSGVRWAYTQRCPAFDAKARGTTMFPERFLLSWDEFVKARAADAERAEALKQEINTMLAAIGDKKLDEMVKEYLRANPGMIVEARNRVAARFEEKQATTKEIAK